ncbi:MAG TPA: hypothetical protein VEL31_26060, partial [Ktedonobacteraceae bacterium]|nr:hypothetical protein [Ktedonobacteraceae bacterium]
MNALKLTSRSTSTTAQPRILDLAPNLQIEIDQVFGHQIAGFGLPGTGKTTFGVRLCEQIGRYPVPMVIFDREGDWLPIADILSRGMIATSTNCPTGYDVLGGGLQVVYDLSSWGDEEAAAAMMCTIVGQLMQWAEALPTHDRVPCLVVLDEAHHWLPQRRGSYLTPDTFRQLFDAFQAVGSTGRKRGLTPAYFCPKISELSKRVLYPGLLAFFRASLDTDLKRYLEHLHCSDLSNDELKARISRFGRGKAIVTLPTGAQQIVTFHNRQSQHVSHTPTVQAAINRYGSLPFDRQASYGTFIASRDEAAMTS